MARRRQPPGRKRRTREHVIADLGVNHVERVVLECGYTVERKTKDYGIDLTIDTFNTKGEIEVGRILVQVKATETVVWTSNGLHLSFRLSVADLKSWLFEMLPVILIVYDARYDAAYWLDVQEYAQAAELDIVNFSTTTVQIPVSNRWTPDVMRILRSRKNQLVARIRRETDA